MPIITPELSETLSLSLHGKESELVRVEVGIRKGLPLFQILGLASPTTKESRDRIRIALEAAGFHFPFDTIIINLHPNHKIKRSSFFDLPIAIGILSASNQFKISPGLIALGSLSLSGNLSGPPELIQLLWAYPNRESSTFILPSELQNSKLPSANYIFIDQLSELKKPLPLKTGNHSPPPQKKNIAWDEVRLSPEQMKTFQGLCYAIVGEHHALMVGNPGLGKTMLAKMVSQIQPPCKKSDLDFRPFRNPHHTTTEQALVGGGTNLRPGEVSLADGGILFLDELTEFKQRALEALREPMEEKKIEHARVLAKESLPADCVIIAATNPCPCGNYLGIKLCHCSKKQIRDYLRKISGPFLDRITIVTFLFAKEEVGNVLVKADLFQEKINSAKIFRDARINTNPYEEPANQFKKIETRVDVPDLRLFSFRQKHNWIALARTIADWELSPQISEEHLVEAFEYVNNARFFDEIK